MTLMNPTPETQPKKKRVRRTPDQIVADLQAKIERTQAQAAVKEAKTTPEGQALIVAARAVLKAAQVGAGNPELAQPLENAKAALGTALVTLGLRMPVPRKGGGRRRHSDEAE